MSLKLCSLAAKGLWIEMMSIMGISERHGYLQIGGIPITNQQLAVMIGVPIKDVDKYMAELESNKVFNRDATGIPYCRRMAREYDEYLEAKANGQLGGNPALIEEESRSKKLEAKGGLAETSNPHLNPKETELFKSLEDFNTFYASYPRKVGCKAALKAWERAKDRPPVANILKAIEAQKESKQWRKDNGQWIPHPSTWLNQGRWADEVFRIEQPKDMI